MVNPLAAIASILGALRAFLTGLAFWRWGAERERRKAAENALQGAEEGRKGASEAKDKLKDGKTPEQIVRENDGSWS